MPTSIQCPQQAGRNRHRTGEHGHRELAPNIFHAFSRCDSNRFDTTLKVASSITYFAGASAACSSVCVLSDIHNMHWRLLGAPFSSGSITSAISAAAIAAAAAAAIADASSFAAAESSSVTAKFSSPESATRAAGSSTTEQAAAAPTTTTDDTATQCTRRFCGR